VEQILAFAIQFRVADGKLLDVDVGGAYRLPRHVSGRYTSPAILHIQLKSIRYIENIV
jgi:hypothetical protein